MAYLVARLMMDNSIMTEKIVRRGLRVSVDYSADRLAGIAVREAASSAVVCLKAEQTVEEAGRWLGSHAPGTTHNGFPVVDEAGDIVGMITRKDLSGEELSPCARVREILKRPPVVIAETASVREAIDLMVANKVGRLPLILPDNPRRVTGIITRSDLLTVYGKQQRKSRQLKRTIQLGGVLS